MRPVRRYFSKEAKSRLIREGRAVDQNEGKTLLSAQPQPRLSGRIIHPGTRRVASELYGSRQDYLVPWQQLCGDVCRVGYGDLASVTVMHRPI